MGDMFCYAKHSHNTIAETSHVVVKPPVSDNFKKEVNENGIHAKDNKNDAALTQP